VNGRGKMSSMESKGHEPHSLSAIRASNGASSQRKVFKWVKLIEMGEKTLTFKQGMISRQYLHPRCTLS
jgi:hypothetical protein